ARTYDWADPTDPEDLYRELALGAIDGTLHFLRPAEREVRGTEASWVDAARAGLYPVASLRASALGSSRRGARTVALAADGAELVVVDDAGKRAPVGATFAELLRYLTLGWKRRDDVEEDLIGALMLKAR